jgi:copper ion binding protein
MAEVRFHVPEIHCNGCVETIRKSVSALSGIEVLEADVEARRIRVEFDAAKTSPEAIRERIERAGFDVGQ